MTSYSYSHKLPPDYAQTYRTMLQSMSKPKVYPKDTSDSSPNSRVYVPSSTVNTVEANNVFLPLFYAGEKGALGIWDKRSGLGTVKRRLDDDDRTYHVLELSNPRTNLGTFIATPKSALNALHITLPHMVMAMKNYRRNFAFDVLVMDSNAYRRRFSFATWYNPSALKKFSFMCQVPLRLEIGWNEIHIDFNELVKSTYKTTFVETIRVQIYANCKLRQIFFCDDRIIKGEIPIPTMRDFNNIRIVPLDYGPRTHPDGVEPGPDKKRNVPYVDPPAQMAPTRLEQDLKTLQRRRYTEVSKQRLMLQPYKTYFRELLHEEKHHKKVEKAANVSLTSSGSTQSSVKSKAVDDQELGNSNLSAAAVTVPVDSTGVSSIFNPNPDDILLHVSEMSQKEHKASSKLPTITEEKDIKVVKVAPPKTPKANEDRDNMRNNNVPDKNVNNMPKLGQDSISTSTVASSQAETNFSKNHSSTYRKPLLK